MKKAKFLQKSSIWFRYIVENRKVVDMFPHMQALSGYVPSKRIIFMSLIFDSYPLISKHIETVVSLLR